VCFFSCQIYPGKGAIEEPSKSAVMAGIRATGDQGRHEDYRHDASGQSNAGQEKNLNCTLQDQVDEYDH
jgi:hypothetical protein